ncbi:unnamed protein product [Amaranthus hypochondriacus]
MFNTLTLLFCAIFLCFFLSSCNAQHKTPFFVFGDSLYDNGMSLCCGVHAGGAKYWPYGENYFKEPSGRFSDGLIIPDFIAQYAVVPLLKPYLSPGVKLDYTDGINFASSTACVLNENCPYAINLKVQLTYFNEAVENLKQSHGESHTRSLLSKAVYLFNIGQYDYVTFFRNNIGKYPLSSSTKSQYIDLILGNLTTHIKRIYEQGGRKFAFQNIGPIGCMPAIKYELGFKEVCADEPSELARLHNHAFAALANNLQIQLPGFNSSIYDFYTALYNRVLFGHTYGFKESETACCGSGAFNGEYSCQKLDRTFSYCNNLKDYLWFDAWHLTQKAYHQISQEFWGGGLDVVAPYNLENLF